MQMVSHALLSVTERVHMQNEHMVCHLHLQFDTSQKYKTFLSFEKLRSDRLNNTVYKDS